MCGPQTSDLFLRTKLNNDVGVDIKFFFFYDRVNNNTDNTQI